MNRIEEIKKARDEFQRINGMILDLSSRSGTGLTLQAQNVHNQFMGSVDDLLSRLEIAEKALVLIAKAYIPSSHEELTEVAETLKQMAEQTLKDMRKEQGGGSGKMEAIAVPATDIHDSPITNHVDFVKYQFAGQELKESAREIPSVLGFLHGKAVVIQYSGGKR
jgi:hypothetical protein